MAIAVASALYERSLPAGWVVVNDGFAWNVFEVPLPFDALICGLNSLVLRASISPSSRVAGAREVLTGWRVASSGSFNGVLLRDELPVDELVDGRLTGDELTVAGLEMDGVESDGSLSGVCSFRALPKLGKLLES